jgi:FixJ family two-component response regulator
VSGTQNIYVHAAHLHTITYSSAETFLADTKRPKFDCLVLDIRLEGMSGLELYQRLLAVKSDTPVVFITAQDDPEVRAQAEASGCAGYFRKTDSGADVLAAIRRAVGLADSDSGRKPEKPTDPEPTP